LSPVVKVLGEIRVPRLGILRVAENTMEDAWQVQLVRNNREGPLMTIALIDDKVVFKKHLFGDDDDAIDLSS
jgi:hypothetical protein